jgi:hypothetical protein
MSVSHIAMNCALAWRLRFLSGPLKTRSPITPGNDRWVSKTVRRIFVSSMLAGAQVELGTFLIFTPGIQ